MAIVKVLLIEDEAFTRSLLSAALTSSLVKVHSGHSAKYALETVASENVDVAVLDLDLGGGPTGIDIAHALRECKPELGLILLTTYSDPRLTGSDERTLPVGTRYITKSTLRNINQLLTVILQSKSQPLSTDKALKASQSELTDHQVEILRLIASGSSNSEIAKLHNVSEKAVENTVTRMIEVLEIKKDSGLNPRVQLVRAFSTLSGNQLPG